MLFSGGSKEEDHFPKANENMHLTSFQQQSEAKPIAMSTTEQFLSRPSLSPNPSLTGTIHAGLCCMYSCMYIVLYEFTSMFIHVYLFTGQCINLVITE